MLESRDERGESLVEILIAMMILGIAAAALLGGLATGFFSSGIHREQTDSGALLASAGESLLDDTLNPYYPCATLANIAHEYNPTNGVSIPTGWSTSDVAITAISWWTAAQNTGQQFATSGSCPDTASGGVLQMQKITVTITSPDGKVSQSRTFLKIGP